MVGVSRKTPKSFWQCGNHWRNTNLFKDIIGDSFVILKFGNINPSPLKIRTIRVIISGNNIYSHGGNRCFQKKWEEENL